MATLEWNTPHPPAPTPLHYPDQLFVDDKRQVFQWSAGAQAWLRRPHMYVQEVERIVFNQFGKNYPAVISTTPTYPYSHWDSLFWRTFVEVSYPITGAPSVYVSHASEEDFRKVIQDTPSVSSIYTDNAVARIFQVIDPSLQVQKQTQHNLMFSSLRGSEAFNRKFGRDKKSLPRNCGYSEGWVGLNGYWLDNYEPYSLFLSAFHGITVPAGNALARNCVWHNVTRNPYRQPKEGSFIQSGSATRYVYNPANSSFEAIVSEIQMFAVGEPKVFGVNNSNPRARSLRSMSSLRGATYFGENVSVMLVYPLVSQSGTLAFYAKPYGVDYFGIGENTDNSNLRLVAEFLDSRGMRRRKMLFNTLPYDPVDQLTGYSIEALNIRSFGTRRSSTSKVPEVIQFYLLDTNTGARSEIMPQKYRITRNKCHIPMCLEPAQ